MISITNRITASNSPHSGEVTKLIDDLSIMHKVDLDELRLWAATATQSVSLLGLTQFVDQSKWLFYYEPSIMAAVLCAIIIVITIIRLSIFRKRYIALVSHIKKYNSIFYSYNLPLGSEKMFSTYEWIPNTFIGHRILQTIIWMNVTISPYVSIYSCVAVFVLIGIVNISIFLESS